MKKLIYEIPVHDDNDAEMIAREIEGILGIRPAHVEEIAPPRDKQDGESMRLGGDSSHSLGMTEGIMKIEGDSSLRSE